jgi:hypothetical protein
VGVIVCPDHNDLSGLFGATLLRNDVVETFLASLVALPYRLVANLSALTPGSPYHGKDNLRKARLDVVRRRAKSRVMGDISRPNVCRQVGHYVN